MIAVFVRHDRDWGLIKFHPKEEFVRIRNPHDLIGRKFTGVLAFFDWWDDGPQIKDAYRYLEQRQPELFKKDE